MHLLYFNIKRIVYLINLENNELEIFTEYINNMYMYNLLETEIYEIDTLISKLENLEIIGENPTIH